METWVLIFMLINTKDAMSATVLDNTHVYPSESECWFHAGLKKASVEKSFELIYDKVGATCVKVTKE